MGRKSNSSSESSSSRRVNALSRCGCGEMVQEGTSHSCRTTSTENFTNPVMRNGKNPYTK